MDFNAYVDKAIKSGIEAGKDQLIKQTLKEDHDYIMFKLHKIFGASYKHIENVLKKYNGDYATETEEVLNILTTMMDDVEEAVTSEKKCNCDGTCKECKCKKEVVEEDELDRIMLEEIPVDKSKRITISYNTLHEAGLEADRELTVLKSKEDENVFYIVNEFFDYDTNRIEFVKTIYHNESTEALRIGVGKLLNVKYGDIVSVDVYDRQLVIYNTGSNVEDMTEGKTDEPEEEEVITNKEVKEFSLNDLLKQVQDKITREDKLKIQPWFVRHYRIEI